MKYLVMANPASGSENIDKKVKKLENVKTILGDCTIKGLDTNSREELRQCARDNAGNAEVVIAAGGDGTLADVINEVSNETTFSYLPLGTGNAMRYNLGMSANLSKAAKQIKEGSISNLDLICYNKRRLFIASLGFDGEVLKARKYKGFKGYALAFTEALKSYKPSDISMMTEEKQVDVQHMMTTIVSTNPFYGYGIKTNPKAINDERLHVVSINSYFNLFYGLIQSLSKKGNRKGIQFDASKVSITSEKDITLEADGEVLDTGKKFSFSILPKYLKMKY
jgi:diacylglycerol kinase family enzyme